MDGARGTEEGEEGEEGRGRLRCPAERSLEAGRPFPPCGRHHVRGEGRKSTDVVSVHLQACDEHPLCSGGIQSSRAAEMNETQSLFLRGLSQQEK